MCSQTSICLMSSSEWLGICPLAVQTNRAIICVYAFVLCLYTHTLTYDHIHMCTYLHVGIVMSMCMFVLCTCNIILVFSFIYTHIYIHVSICVYKLTFVCFFSPFCLYVAALRFQFKSI